ncbi:formylglycine-generating enzyme family protein [Cellulomonas sp. NPDC057328]|uniref:formylglycine-generating enzyme family protein n=1 Tax=Cellulomonas sp. NPDC057328 TaxID=3346101 RepID=UPI0036397A4E
MPRADIPLVDAPAGRVRLSDRRSERTWDVPVGAFRIGAAPVTSGQLAGLRDDAATDPALPAVGASWWDAVRLCNALSVRDGLPPCYDVDEAREHVAWDRGADGYRLPTEAEWEHACRAGTTGPRYGDLDAIAWYRGTSGERLHPVGTKQPNAWGLHDTLGLVWEWCWDLYDPEVYGSYRVLRGGGWFDEHWSVRASVRRRSHPTLSIDDVGFRVVRDA